MELLLRYLSDYGYPTLFLVVLLESFGIPGPGQALLIAAALLAAHGKLNIVAVLVTAVTATTLGGCIGYWIGTRGGRRLILRFGRYVRIGEPELLKLERSFDRYGFWFVLTARFFEVLRQIQGIVAGIVEMPFRRFFAANLLGGLLWSCTWGLGSWRLGRQIQSYDDLTEKAGILFVAMLLLVLLVLLGMYLKHRWKNQGRG
ncbi:MAG TPA: DedA family protein [Gammaproteobacteria bacterium]|jgi:membrane protein DedA with SNARE-associated domain|nr:DedA family protein [Gammaproteobacteria bacterium]